MSDQADSTGEAEGGDLAADRCFVLYEGRVHAILNWQLRRSMGDAIISRPLSREEEATYRAGRDAGRDDQAIFQSLFPAPVRSTLALADLQERTKNQLIHLIMNRVGISLPSLMKMTKVDLCRLYLGLGRRTTDLGARRE